MAQARGSKVVSHAARKTREAMLAKLTELIAREYPGVPVSTAYERIREATGLSLSTMQRVMSGKTGPSIDTLSDLARHLGATVAELVTQETGTESNTVPFRKRQPSGGDEKSPKSSRNPPY
jgi:transcriptional regulator with XRE-family HTH domain